MEAGAARSRRPGRGRREGSRGRGGGGDAMNRNGGHYARGLDVRAGLAFRHAADQSKQRLLFGRIAVPSKEVSKLDVGLLAARGDVWNVPNKSSALVGVAEVPAVAVGAGVELFGSEAQSCLRKPSVPQPAPRPRFQLSRCFI